MRYQGVGMLAVVFGVAASGGAPVVVAAQDTTERPYLLEQIGDAAIVQLYADGFESLPLREKTLVWHLYQAALAILACTSLLEVTCVLLKRLEQASSTL